MKGICWNSLPTPMTNTAPPNLEACRRAISKRSKRLIHGITYVNAGVDTAFDAGAFDHQLGFLPQCLLDVLRVRLSVCVFLDLYRAHTRYQRLGLGKTVFVEISDDDWRCTSCMRRKKADYANGTGSTDDERVTQPKAGAIDTSKRD